MPSSAINTVIYANTVQERDTAVHYDSINELWLGHAVFISLTVEMLDVWFEYSK